ncbi:MAG: Crp/Fnr family transcriptional regulator [Ruminococcaceae bacterium]|nr:Crp/Fnr family transcriptional regulator [Oscillospiraceae bacterium]
MNIDFISETALFRGCSKDDIEKMAEHFGFGTFQYKRGAVIFSEGSVTANLGLILSGSIRIEHNDFWGNKSILDVVEAGGIFAEAYACIPNEPMIIDVIANEDCEILFIGAAKLFEPCSVCKGQNRVMQNLVAICAQKNLQLSRRSLHTSPKTIRRLLLSYFSQQMSVQGSNQITIPFDRQQLADYLNLDRSALSKELGKMKKDGLIDYRKNHFEIKIYERFY